MEGLLLTSLILLERERE